jgi:phage terminase large subunit
VQGVTTLRIQTAKVFEPLLVPARYKGIHGGRGSGKSHFFGELTIEDALAAPGDYGEGLRMVCIREVQKDLTQSSKLLIEDKIRRFGLTEAHGFHPWKDRTELPGDGIIIYKGMTDYTADSVKSLEGFHRAWIEEAQTISERSLSLLRPTIRAKGSQIWASWNPTLRKDAIEKFLRGPEGAPTGAIVLQANWRDNPFWTDELEAERVLELERYPERYPHTYEGEFAQAFEGAYFAKLLTEAKQQGRIGSINADPLLPVRAFADIGGSGANSDAFVFWVVQFVDGDILVLDHYETVGQSIAYHVKWLRDRGYQDAEVVLPHDGAHNDATGKRYEDHFREADFKTRVIPNQGKGAAAMRIEAVRRLAPKFRFNAVATESGRLALGFYHEKKDDKRNVGLGPEHDWSSHSADAFGLMACCYEPPAQSANFGRELNYGDSGWR